MEGCEGRVGGWFLMGNLGGIEDGMKMWLGCNMCLNWGEGGRRVCVFIRGWVGKFCVVVFMGNV